MSRPLGALVFTAVQLLILYGHHQLSVPCPTCDCDASVRVTAQNCMESIDKMAHTADGMLKEVYLGLQACVWLEEEGYDAVEASTSRQGWDRAMERVDAAELHQINAYLKYFDYFGEERFN